MGIVFSIFFSDILPVFAIAIAGFMLARFAGAQVQTLARAAFYVLMPCLAFKMLSTSVENGPAFSPVIAAAVLVTLVMGAVGYLCARALGLRGAELRAFLLVVMFSNGGNYGLPVVRFAFGSNALTYGAVFFLTGSVMTYVTGAFFAGSRHGQLRGAIEKVFRMPSLYGVALALIAMWIGKPVPEAIMRPVSMLSDAALPVMILVLGMQLERATIPEKPHLVLIAVGISLLIAPFVALGLCTGMGITGPARQAVVILSSMPVAVVTTILALEFDMSPTFVTGAVFLSTVLSPLTLTPLIAYLS